MKNKHGQLSTGSIVMLVMGIIVALILIQAIFSSQTQITTKSTTVNESLSLASARLAGSGSINTTRYFNLANGCPQTIGNWRLSDTGDCAISVTSITLLNGTALTATTDYIINTTAGIGQTSCDNFKNGDITFVNSTRLGLQVLNTNSTVVTYTFCGDGYSTNSASRTIASLIGLFSALALLGFVIYMGVSQWLENM